MDRHFLEWKEKGTTSRLLVLIRTALLTGIASGITIYLLIDVAIMGIERGSTYTIACIVLGIIFGLFVKSLCKDYKEQIRRAINPLIWDLRLLHDRNIRLDNEITQLEKMLNMGHKDADSEEIEYVGEKKRVVEDDKTDVD